MLIDTNVWSELTRARPEPAVTTFMAANLSLSWLSTIVLAEIRYGIVRTPDTIRRERLSSWLDDLLVRIDDRIVGFDTGAATVYADLRARLDTAGTRVADMDLLIAAQSIAADMPLVTRNVGDMDRSGATIINPWPA